MERRSPFMSPSSRRAAAQRRRRARRRGVLLTLAVAVLLGLGVMVTTAGDRGTGTTSAASSSAKGVDGPGGAGQTALGPLPLQVNLDDARDEVRIPFGKPPRAGILVNLDTGNVLWRRRPTRVLPIASLTKMMTGLVAVERLEPHDRIRITRSVVHYTGSGVGVLPKGKRVSAESMLWGLMLPSGNDAARALAFRSAGSIRGYVRLMNRKAGELGLRCTHFASVEGLSARNRSCPADLAVLAKKVIEVPRLARIVKRRKAVLPFPVKGGKLELYNHNPLVREGYPGILGVKTGWTDPAGRCLVAVARRNGVTLAAVVLNSSDTGGHARKLLNRGFRASARR